MSIPTVHTLKSWPMFFQDIKAGIRTSDIRYEGDRFPFSMGDMLELHEWDPVTGEYTGQRLRAMVTYVQRNRSNPCAISMHALHNDYAVLSIKVTE